MFKAIYNNYDLYLKEGKQRYLFDSYITKITDFYLNDFDHFIKEELKIKCYIRYQDDMLLIHEFKEYLKECLIKIKLELAKVKLTLNHKTRIYKSNENMNFIGVRKNRK